MEKAAYLIGHGNMKLEEFFRILKEKKVDVLIDVRSAPFSKYVPDFNKERLKEFLLKNNIDYVHMGGILGGRHTEGFAKYMNSNEFKKGIALLQEGIIGSRAAIMCSEIDYRRCHRRFIGLKLADEGFIVEDISKRGIIQKIGQKTLVSF
ncbi:DUF488 domain-containing protein [Candidatus Woesearchaeota archaeon]|nr:DUF488 domain-containing protein [Candidatus Woesearchaeota archaeon]